MENFENKLNSNSETDKLPHFGNDSSGDYGEETEIKLITPQTKKSQIIHPSSRMFNSNNDDTHSRIFGETVEDAPQNRTRKSDQKLADKKAALLRQEERAVYAKKPDGNPLTGEGYDENISQARLKVPPGGYSSKLW